MQLLTQDLNQMSSWDLEVDLQSMLIEQEKVTDLLALRHKIITYGLIGMMYQKCQELME